MAAERFSFDGALMHFRRTPAPGGFFWKFLIAYGVLYTLAGAAIFALIGPGYLRLIQMGMESPNGDLPPEEVWSVLGPILGGYALATPVFLMVWAMLEAAVQRRYTRLEGFRLGLGGDEFRLAAVALLYFVLFIGLYIASAIVIGIPFAIIAAAAAGGGGEAMGIVGGLLAFVLVIAVICFWIFVLVRLSPAAAMTIRDRKIHFFGAWGASKGRFWPLFGAFLIVMVVSAIAGQVLQMILMFGLMGAVIPQMDALESGDFSGLLSSPALWISGLLMLIGYVVVYAGTHFIGAGIPAHAANTDPRGGGLASHGDTFN